MKGIFGAKNVNGKEVKIEQVLDAMNFRSVYTQECKKDNSFFELGDLGKIKKNLLFMDSFGDIRSA